MLDWRRAAKLLRLLASDQAGEVLAAAGALNRIDPGLHTIAESLKGKVSVVAPPPMTPEQYARYCASV